MPKDNKKDKKKETGFFSTLADELSMIKKKGMKSHLDSAKDEDLKKSSRGMRPRYRGK